jgi:hypothetical protein
MEGPGRPLYPLWNHCDKQYDGECEEGYCTLLKWSIAGYTYAIF